MQQNGSETLMEIRSNPVKTSPNRPSEGRLVLGPSPPELLADKALMLKALEFNAYAVEYLPSELLSDEEIWLTAVRQPFGVHSSH